MVSENFTPANAQFGFQTNVSIQQENLRAQTKARRGVRHTAMLDLEKACDKLNMEKIVYALAKHLQSNVLNMARATLLPLQLRTKNDPTMREATVTRGVPQGAPSSPIYFNVYVNELALEAEEWTNRRGVRDGEMVLVADDVLIQAASRYELQELLNVATKWKDRLHAHWSVAKSFYVTLMNGEGNEAVYIDGQRMEVRGSETYLGMTLMANGLTDENSIRRVKKAYPEVFAVSGSGWWTLDLAPRQIQPVFQALIRSKYAYGLPLIETQEEVRDKDERWMVMAAKALLWTKANLPYVAKSKVWELLQWEAVQGAIGREARRLIRRWITVAERQDEAALRTKESLRQAASLPRGTPQKRAWEQSQLGEVDEGERLMAKCNEANQPRRIGRTRGGDQPDEPPHIDDRKAFPTWLSTRKISAGVKRSKIRWFLYWFPVRGPILEREARCLDTLKEG